MRAIVMNQNGGIVHVGELKAGQTVLIHGGAGGLVLDTVGQGTLMDRCTEVVKSGGKYAEIETLLSAASVEEKAAAAAKGVELLYNMIAAHRMPEQLANLAKLLAQGKIKPPQFEILPLSAAAHAQNRVQEGHVRGKLVLKVA